VKPCKDCVAEQDGPPLRPRAIVPDSGGRCMTHWRAEKKRRLEQSHRRRVKSQYGLGDGMYEALYEGQGGRCYICRRATGASRRLSVDHDHVTGLVRGLLCRPCNSMLGHARDDIPFLQRAMAYLISPPAFTIIGEVKPENGQ
jgi:recombination endonuclease VII